MGLISKLLGGEVVNLAEGVAGVVDRFIETPDEKRIAKQLIAKGQNEINALSAKHQSRFVSGARPAILWVCAISLFFYFVPQYVMAAILWTMKSWSAQAILPYPVDASGLMELTLGLLGLAGLRTLERLGGKVK